MGFRTALNKQATVVVPIVVIVVGVALWYSLSHSLSGGSVPTAKYFTIDDGATYFAGDVLDFAPFQKDGKEAVRAYVFECDGKAFVGYLERFKPEARKAMEELVSANRERRPPRNVAALAAASQTGIELKRPGEQVWVSGAPGPKSSEIRHVKCKDGTTALPRNTQ